MKVDFIRKKQKYTIILFQQKLIIVISNIIFFSRSWIEDWIEEKNAFVNMFAIDIDTKHSPAGDNFYNRTRTNFH